MLTGNKLLEGTVNSWRWGNFHVGKGRQGTDINSAPEGSKFLWLQNRYEAIICQARQRTRQEADLLDSSGFTAASDGTRCALEKRATKFKLPVYLDQDLTVDTHAEGRGAWGYRARRLPSFATDPPRPRPQPRASAQLRRPDPRDQGKRDPKRQDTTGKWYGKGEGRLREATWTRRGPQVLNAGSLPRPHPAPAATGNPRRYNWPDAAKQPTPLSPDSQLWQLELAAQPRRRYRAPLLPLGPLGVVVYLMLKSKELLGESDSRRNCISHDTRWLVLRVTFPEEAGLAGTWVLRRRPLVLFFLLKCQ